MIRTQIQLDETTPHTGEAEGLCGEQVAGPQSSGRR